MSGDNRDRHKSPGPSSSRPITPLFDLPPLSTSTLKQTDHAISSSSEEDGSPWTTAARRKPQPKRPRTSTDSVTSDIQTSPPPVTTRNPFTVLPIDEPPAPSRQTASLLPPPVYVRHINNYGDLRQDLNTTVGSGNYETKPTATGLLIKTKTSDAYRALHRYLTGQNAQFHTYQNPQEKTLRAVIRNLHHTTPTDMITDELTAKGYSVRTVQNVLQRQTRRPLHLFFVDLDQTDHNKTIFGLTSLLNSKITVEEPHRRHDIPQCHRCQNYHHTKTYCHHDPRCVKCGGKHESASCKKERTSPAKCALCSGSHPANYKGCSVYQDLQKKRRPTTTTPSTTTKGYNTTASSNTPPPSLPVNIPSRPVNNSSIVHSVPPVYSPPVPPRRLTYAQAALPRQSYTATSTSTTTTAPPTQDTLTNTLNSFLSDLKNLLTPIVTLLTTVITELINKNVK